ncbi:MAG: hypothetical protein CL489_12005 [Acidobacteria bacterium]|nr:hypothetical protein [Acidobacteriota bacterium]
MAKTQIDPNTLIPPKRPDINKVQTQAPGPYQKDQQAQDTIGRVRGINASQANTTRDVSQENLGHMASARDLYRGIATGERPGAAQGILDQARRGALASQASGRGGAGLAQMGATRAMGDASMAAIPQIMQERQAALQGYAGTSKDMGELGLGRAKMANEMREMQAGRDDRIKSDMERIAAALINKGVDQQTAWMQAEGQARSNEQNLMAQMYGYDTQAATQRAIAERQEGGLLDDSNWLDNATNPDWWFGKNSAFQAPVRWGKSFVDYMTENAPYGEGQSQEQGAEKAPYGSSAQSLTDFAEKGPQREFKNVLPLLLTSPEEQGHPPPLKTSVEDYFTFPDVRGDTRMHPTPFRGDAVKEDGHGPWDIPYLPPSLIRQLGEVGNLSEQETQSILPWFIRFLGETGNLSRHEAERGKEDSSKKTEKAPFSMGAPPSSFPGAVGAAAQGMPGPGQGINPDLLSTSEMMESEQRRLRRIQDELGQGQTGSALNYLGQGLGQLPNVMGAMGGGRSGDAAAQALGGAIGMGIGSSIPVVGPVAGPLLSMAGSYIGGEL